MLVVNFGEEIINHTLLLMSREALDMSHDILLARVFMCFKEVDIRESIFVLLSSYFSICVPFAIFLE